MIDKISVIHDKSQELHKMKYMSPKASNEDIDFMIKDIQALCREVANDKGKYGKYPAKKNA
jgi:hypothetical protein